MTNLEQEINNTPLNVREELFKRGLNEGLKHTQPSPETLERFGKVDETLLKITDALEEITTILKRKYE